MLLQQCAHVSPFINHGKLTMANCPFLSCPATGMSPSSSCSSLDQCQMQEAQLQPELSSLSIHSSSPWPSTSGCPFAAGLVAADSPSPSMSNSSSSSSLEDCCVQQAWQLKRPVLQHDVKLTRRQLRRLNKTWSLADVAQHKYCDDGWIAVDGRVYDITEHIVSHPGWDSGCQVTTVLSIIAHLGTDCSQEFKDIHSPYPQAWHQLRAFYIGNLEC